MLQLQVLFSISATQVNKLLLVDKKQLQLIGVSIRRQEIQAASDSNSINILLITQIVKFILEQDNWNIWI